MLSNKVQYISRILRPRTCGNYLPNFIAYPSDWHLLPITSCEASDICNGPNLQDGLIIIITRLGQPTSFWVGIAFTLTKPFIKENIFTGQFEFTYTYNHQSSYNSW